MAVVMRPIGGGHQDTRRPRREPISGLKVAGYIGLCAATRPGAAFLAATRPDLDIFRPHDVAV